MELEEARSRRKDPRSFSEIFCFKQCVSGPREKSRSALVANLVNALMLAFNVLMLTYALKGCWVWFSYMNIGIGLVAQVLMWCVQCSDPGILSREQDESKLPFLKD